MDEWSHFTSSGSEFDMSDSDYVVSSSDSDYKSILRKKSKKKLKSKSAPKKRCKKGQPARSNLPACPYEKASLEKQCSYENNINGPKGSNKVLQTRSSPQPSCSYHYTPEIQRTVNNTPVNSKEPIEKKEHKKPEQKVGRKRKQNTEAWKRNIKKKSHFGALQSRPIRNCRCKCASKLNIEEQNIIFQQFKAFSASTEQNIYLKGCTEPHTPRRLRNRKENAKRRSVSYRYKVQVGEKTIQVCQNAFLDLHGIKRSRLRRKIQISSTVLKDLRGRHESRPNRIGTDILNKVRRFIEELPARESHYSRTQNKLRKYLEADLSVAELHRRFLKENRDETKISYEMFRRVFTEEFNISFGYPRKDICKTCTTLLVSLQQANLNSNDDKKNELKVQHELHLRKASVFQTELKDIVKEKNPNILAICFDYQKNMPVPVTNIQDEYYLRQLWIHNLGIKNLATNQTTMYMYAEHFAHKGPNEVISCLHDFITQHRTQNHKILKLYCDNCFSQNKNRFLFAFLDQLCLKNVFESIQILYPVPGHSMMPIDRDFGLIEKRKLKIDKIDNPEYYVNLVRSCNMKHPFKCVFVQHSLRSDGKLKEDDRIIKIKDFKGWLTPHLKPCISGISQARFIQFYKGVRPKLKESYFGELKEIKLYRIGQSRLIAGTPTLAYGESYLSIKCAKLQNIMHLLGFVTSDTEFFKRTLTDNAKAVRRPARNEDLEQKIDSDTDIYE